MHLPYYNKLSKTKIHLGLNLTFKRDQRLLDIHLHWFALYLDIEGETRFAHYVFHIEERLGLAQDSLN
jgi:hypothetical protein